MPGTLGIKIGLAVVTLAVVAWLVDDYYYLNRERARLKSELQEAVLANQSLVEAHQRAERRHQAESRARDRLEALERGRQEVLVDLVRHLAALPVREDCVGGEGLQDLIDSLRETPQ